MILQNSASLHTCANKVIIGSNANPPSNIDGELLTLFNDFIEKDTDYAEVIGFSESFFFVRSNDDQEKLRGAGAKVRTSLSRVAKEIAFIGEVNSVFLAMEGFLLGSYQFNKYFTDKNEKDYLLESIYVDDSFEANSITELLNISKAVTWARNMVNEPVSFLNADQLAKEIFNLSNEVDFNVTVLEKTQIESLKMGGLLSVNQGSIDQPTFTIVEYKPENAKNKQPIVLVGKGVVYDTGGLSLKPTPNSMDVMKSDMGGAACMAGAIYLAALQKLPVHLICLIPATDNRPGLNAYAPGDVVTMYNGSTVEVLNTDAEGRMILADALAYSKKYNPELVIDAATLTGAAYRAIGAQASIIMGNADQKYFEQLEKAGEQMHERTVKFPFWDEYLEDMKSDIADLKNIGGPTAGMITAGKFLETFVEAPYIHMDIAGPAWLNKKDTYRTKGGSGVGVRLVYQFLKNK